VLRQRRHDRIAARFTDALAFPTYLRRDAYATAS